MTLTLLAALLHCRCREITDTLVELLCSTVHRINARAEVRVTNQLIKEFKRVTGKENLLFRVAEATVDAGDKLVRDTVYPVAPQAVLRDLVAEFKSSGPTYQRTVKATLGVLHQPLPGRDDQAAVGAGVPQQQHHPPAGAGRAGTDRPLRQAGTCVTTRPVRPYRCIAASPATGRSWCISRTTRTTDSAWCGWCTRCARFRRCGTSCGARRSGS